MPEIKVVDMAGNDVGVMELSDKIFAVEVNKAVLHAAVRAYLMNQRQGTQSALTRTEVSGGGKKPWRQKGTGRARQGSTRAPQWTHGGVVFAPKPREYRLDMNKKTKKVALFSALTAKFDAGEIIVVDDIKLDDYRTAAIAEMLEDLGCEKEITVTYKDAETKKIFDETHQRTCKKRTATVPQKALIVLPEVNNFVIKSAANIKGAVPGAKDGIVFIRDSVKA